MAFDFRALLTTEQGHCEPEGLVAANIERPLEPQTHSIGLPPYGYAGLGHMTEGQVKFTREGNLLWQQQPSAVGREVSYRAWDNRVLLNQDYPCAWAMVPRAPSPFNTFIH
jgi:hypothetical protein